MKKLKCIFLLLITMSSCTNYFEHKLKIINNSKEDVFFDFRFTDELNSSDSINSQGDTLRVNDSVRPPSRESWQDIIRRNSKDSKIGILFVKKQLLKKESWKEIIEKKQYKIQTYTISELDSLKWIIIYDSDSAFYDKKQL